MKNKIMITDFKKVTGDLDNNEKISIIEGKYSNGDQNFNDGKLKNTPLQTSSNIINILDLSDDDNYNNVIKTFGGENTLQKFPSISEGIKAARQRAVMHNENDDCTLEFHDNSSDISLIGVESKSSENSVKSNTLSDEYYNYYKLGMTYSVSVQNVQNNCMDNTDDVITPIPTQCTCNIQITEIETGNVILKESRYFFENIDCNTIYLETGPQLYSYIEGKKIEFKVDTIYGWHDGKIIAIDSVKRNIYVGEQKPVVFISKITIDDPHLKHSTTPDIDPHPIMFMYGRTPDSNPEFEGADYWDSDRFYFHNRMSNGVLGTIIPIKGAIELQNLNNDKYKVKNVSIHSYMSNVKVPASELVYNVNDKNITISSHGKDYNTKDTDLGVIMQNNGDLVFNPVNMTANFDLKLPQKSADISPYDWYCNLSGGYLDNSDHTCKLLAHFVLDVEHDMLLGQDHNQYTINIYSTNELPEGFKYYESICKDGMQSVYIPQLKIMWGCYARDTLVLLNDGRTKRADEVIIGDRLRTSDGNTDEIINIITGYENTILNITATDNRHIRVTSNHPMKLYDNMNSDGITVSAGKLKEGDVLMMQDGTATVKSVVSEPYNDIVFNFIFRKNKDQEYIVANEFLSGDFNAQNYSCKQRRELSEEQKKIVEEFRDLAKSLSGR